jgi:arabinose-5-phosphate isomerase
LNNLFILAEAVDRNGILARGREVVGIEAEALALLQDSLDLQFVRACEAIFHAERQLVVSGMGKSGHIGRKVAATFAATGTPAVFMHPAEAAHGDIGMLVRGDVLLVFSNSGNTSELRSILSYARDNGVTIIGAGSKKTSLLMEFADIAICLPMTREACNANVAPTTSTTLQLALGDALAMAVMDMRGVSKNRLRTLHPGGNIGLELTPVSEVMHGAHELPLVSERSGMPDAISKMTSERFGVCGVVNDSGALVGVITDGDLRRHFDMLLTANAGEVMTRSPKVISVDMLAADALLFLNDNKITVAFVVNRADSCLPQHPVGIVHIHDLLRLGLS